MSGTLYYNFPYIASNQAAKEVTCNEAFDDIDAAIHAAGGLTNPMTATGDIIYEAGSPPAPTRLPIGTTGQVLTVASGAPGWATPSGGGGGGGGAVAAHTSRRYALVSLTDASGTVTGYSARPGWDPATGWGSPDAQLLVPLLAQPYHPRQRI